jgi:phosphoserine aminotransferase
MGVLLDREEAAYDVIPHPKAPAGLRIWCGPTVDADDLVALGPWLDWAYHDRACENPADETPSQGFDSALPPLALRSA